MATAIKAAGIVLALVLGLSSSAIAVGAPINCMYPPDLSDPIVYTKACPGDPGFPSNVFAGGRDVSIKLPETRTCYRRLRVSNARNTRITGGKFVCNVPTSVSAPPPVVYIDSTSGASFIDCVHIDVNNRRSDAIRTFRHKGQLIVQNVLIEGLGGAPAGASRSAVSALGGGPMQDLALQNVTVITENTGVDLAYCPDIRGGTRNLMLNRVNVSYLGDAPTSPDSPFLLRVGGDGDARYQVPPVGASLSQVYVDTGALTVPFYDAVYAGAQPTPTSCSDFDARHGIAGQVCDGAPPQGSFAERFMVGANYHRGNFCIGDPDTGPVPPPQAIAAGFTELAFSDEFLTADGIDINNTGQPGFNWYFARPFKYPPSPANNVSVADGVLTIDTDGHSNMGMLSIRKAGAGWDGFAVTGGAYFEASIAFDPDVQSIHPRGWPSFWTMGAGHLYGTESPFIEVDFFEYDTPSAGKNTYGAAIHDWIMAPTATKRNSNKSNFVARAGDVDWTKFNTVGGLVKPGEGIDFYFNNALTLTNPYSKYPWMAYADTEQLPVILGSDGWPMKVDWVRVWTR